MRESADADVIFVASGLPNSHMFISFCSLTLRFWLKLKAQVQELKSS